MLGKGGGALHNYSKGIIITHDYCYFAILGKKMCFLKKNIFISQNHWSLTENRVMGTENNLWKIELDSIIFLDFTDI